MFRENNWFFIIWFKSNAVINIENIFYCLVGTKKYLSTAIEYQLKIIDYENYQRTPNTTINNFFLKKKTDE